MLEPGQLPVVKPPTPSTADPSELDQAPLLLASEAHLSEVLKVAHPRVWCTCCCPQEGDPGQVAPPLEANQKENSEKRRRGKIRRCNEPE